MKNIYKNHGTKLTLKPKVLISHCFASVEIDRINMACKFHKTISVNILVGISKYLRNSHNFFCFNLTIYYRL